MIPLRSVLALAFLTTVLFVGVLGAARMQPFGDHVSARFGDCNIPCWRGVKPGATPIEDAVTRLTAVNGSQPDRHPCSGTPITPCYHYTWRSGDQGLLSTDLEFHPGVYEVITAHTPGFTLGEALLTLDDMGVRFYGAYPGYEADQAFNFQLLFENSRLTLFTAAPCPGSYFTLMQTPLKSLNVNYPNLNMRYAPDLSFAAIRRMFFQLCMR
jgi:hypothetical protein